VSPPVSISVPEDLGARELASDTRFTGACARHENSHTGPTRKLDQLRKQVFLQRSTCERCAGGELVAHVVRNVTDGDIGGHACNVAILHALCKRPHDRGAVEFAATDSMEASSPLPARLVKLTASPKYDEGQQGGAASPQDEIRYSVQDNERERTVEPTVNFAHIVTRDEI
jgi:hypothetical protein